MKTARLPVLAIVFLAAASSGCLKRPGPPVGWGEAGPSDPEAIYQGIRGQSKQIHTLQGTAHLQLQTEQEKVGLDAVIVCDRGRGRLRFEVEDLLNHVVFLALFDPEGFLTYSAADNEYRQGPDGAAGIQGMVGIPLDPEQLSALATGDPFFLSIRSPTVRASMDGDALLLDVEPLGTGPRYLVWLDEARRPRRVLVIRSPENGRTVGNLQVDYGRYRKLEAVSFPHRIRVADTGSARFFQVDYQKVLLNKPLEEGLFRFVPPAGASRTESDAWGP
jgi:hypothetical protein